MKKTHREREGERERQKDGKEGERIEMLGERKKNIFSLDVYAGIMDISYLNTNIKNKANRI